MPFIIFNYFIEKIETYFYIINKSKIIIMEEINLDLNNLFNLSYSFEGLKILLTSIAKNQDIMLQKIKQLENNQKLNEKNNIKFIPQKIVETKKVEDKNHANENKEAMNTNSDKDKDIYTLNSFSITFLYFKNLIKIEKAELIFNLKMIFLTFFKLLI
jgi:hypothetical protein